MINNKMPTFSNTDISKEMNAIFYKNRISLVNIFDDTNTIYSLNETK